MYHKFYAKDPTGKYKPETLKYYRQNNQGRQSKYLKPSYTFNEQNIPIGSTVFFLWLLLTSNMIPPANTPRIKYNPELPDNNRSIKINDFHLILSNSSATALEQSLNNTEVNDHDIGLSIANEKIDNQKIYVLPSELSCKKNNLGINHEKKICTVTNNKRNSSVNFFLKVIDNQNV
ncbi:MAG: hypothetical protein HYX60_02955, partial [Legionella longbeachae]|nr:hypothetical protein [Legionella longbeachae]